MTDLLTQYSGGFRELTIDEILRRKALIDGAKNAAAKNEPSVVTPGPAFFANFTADAMTFGPVLHRGELYAVTLSLQHLDGGHNKTMTSWQMYLAGSEWQLASVPLQMAYLSTLLRESDGLFKESVKTIRDLIREDYAPSEQGPVAATGSYVFYASTGLDDVVHNYGSPSVYYEGASINGSGGRLNSACGLEDALDAIVSTRDIVSINAVSQWLCGSDAYLSCFRGKNARVIERCVTLSVGHRGRFYINADTDVGQSRPARGVSLQKMEAPR